jgi:hypothetical protein
LNAEQLLRLDPRDPAGKANLADRLRALEADKPEELNILKDELLGLIRCPCEPMARRSQAAIVAAFCWRTLTAEAPEILIGQLEAVAASEFSDEQIQPLVADLPLGSPDRPVPEFLFLQALVTCILNLTRIEGSRFLRRVRALAERTRFAAWMDRAVALKEKREKL